jgi:hypothetical protein
MKKITSEKVVISSCHIYLPQQGNSGFSIFLFISVVKGYRANKLVLNTVSHFTQKAVLKTKKL